MAQIKASTQKFTEILDIADNAVIFDNQTACLIVEIQAANFALLSMEEQQAKIYAYASLLNSLSFPVQVIIRNKRVNIAQYLKLIDNEAQKISASLDPNNQKLFSYIRLYREFVGELVKINTVLDKKFYIAIPFSALEGGVKGYLKKDDFAGQAQSSLNTKAQSLLNQLARLNLRAKILEKEDLIKLFYEIYNQNLGENSNIEESIKTPIVRGGK